MNRKEFFLAAMRAGEYRRTAWVISAFSQIMEGPDDWRKDPYPYRIVQTLTGMFFVNPENKEELVLIEDAKPGEALFLMREAVDFKAGEIENLREDTSTTYGNALFNHICLIYPFGKKVGYINGSIHSSAIEARIIDRLKDNPKPDEAPPQVDDGVAPIYVFEYLKFTAAMFSLSAYTQLCVPASTEKSITPPPGVIELRNRLLQENKDRLHDPAVIAMIDKQLIAYLRDWLKDDPSMGFLTDKSLNNVRRKLYLMGGAESGMESGTSVSLIKESLSEGWNPDNFAIMNTSSRAGSFSRGAQTELGGEATKWLFRASSNMLVAGDDCGSNLGVLINAPLGKERDLIGFTVIEGNGKQTKVTQDNVETYLGKTLRKRSPMFCKMTKTDFCKVCVGERLSLSPNGLSVAVADYGSTFMLVSMKAMHDTSVKVAKMNYKAAFT